MSKKLKIKLINEVADTVARAKAAASRNGVSLEGDHLAGRFSGHGIEGEYIVSEGEVSITIARKPLLVPWSVIEHRVVEFFSQEQA